MDSFSIFIRTPYITRRNEYQKLSSLMREIGYFLELRGIDYKSNLTKNDGEMRFVVHLHNDNPIDILKDELREAFYSYKILVYS